MAKEKQKLTEEQYASLEIVTGRFVGSHPHIFEMAKYEGKETSYQITMLFKKTTDMKELRNRLHRAKVFAWGKDQAKWPQGIESPIKDGDKEEDETYHGYWKVMATSNKQIVPVDAAGNDILKASEVYGGAIYRAHIQAAVYEVSKKNLGVKFYLKGLQKVAEGEKLGAGSKRSKKAFAETPDEGDEGENDPSNYDDSDGDSDTDSAMW